jgi:hypothetical protein
MTSSTASLTISFSFSPSRITADAATTGATAYPDADPSAASSTVPFRTTSPDIMNGNLDAILEPLAAHFQAEKLREAVEAK